MVDLNCVPTSDSSLLSAALGSLLGAAASISIWFIDKRSERRKSIALELNKKRELIAAIECAFEDIQENMSLVVRVCDEKSAELKRVSELRDGALQANVKDVAKSIEDKLRYISPRIFEELLSVDVWILIPNKYDLSLLGALRSELGALQSRLKAFNCCDGAPFSASGGGLAQDVDISVEAWLNCVNDDFERLRRSADRITALIDRLRSGGLEEREDGL